MAEEAAEVKVRLVIDSNAEKVTEEMKKSFDGLSASAGVTSRRIDTGFKANMASAGALGMSITTAVVGATLAAAAGVAAFGVAATHAFLESENQVRRLSGAFLLLDKGGNSFEKIHKYAADVKDELEQMGIEAGVSDDTMVDMFSDIMERGGKSVDQVMKLTKEMATAGRAIPGGGEALAEGFRNIELGMIKAKNPIVQMIAATGMLKGNAKHVATAMQQMPVEKQMKIAEAAVAKMAKRLEAMPLSVGQMATSMKVMGQNVLETIGEPITAAIGPVLDKLRHFFMDHAQEITAVAKDVGAFLGQVVELGGGALYAVIKEVHTNAADIKVIFKAAFGDAKDTFKYIYENKDAFAKTFGDITRDIIKAARFMADVFSEISKDISKAISAISGFAKSGYLGKGMQDAAVQDTQSKLLAKTHAAAMSPTGFGKGESLEGTVKAARENIPAGEGALEKAQAAENEIRAAWSFHEGVMGEINKAESDSAFNDANRFAEVFNNFNAKHNQAAMDYIASFVAGNTQMQEALAITGSQIFGDGVDAFLDSLKKASANAADKLGKAWDPNLKTDKGHTTNNNFSGGINIKQDFRDQDPDRIALIFQRDLAKAASNRVQASTTTAFGG